MINFAKNLSLKALDLILPATCPMTGEIVDTPGMVSADYWSHLTFFDGDACHCCGATIATVHNKHSNQDNIKENGVLCGYCLSTPPLYDHHRSALKYDDYSKPLILKFKHYDQHHLTRCFSPWLISAMQGLPDQDFDLIVPVPLHYKRLLYRKYNQAALLAKSISKKTGIPWASDSLRRLKHTDTQGFKNASERRKNVKNAFIVPEHSRERISDRHILLIDDVYTTGATLNECTKALKAAGASKVSCVTLARALKD